MLTLSDVVLGLAVIVALPAEGSPQGQMGGKVVGLPPGRHATPKAEEARVVSVEEFRQLPTASSQPELVEDALVKRLPDEQDVGARAAIIATLAETVRSGSPKGRQIVLEALHDTNVAVRLAAATGVARFHAPEKRSRL